MKMAVCKIALTVLAAAVPCDSRADDRGFYAGVESAAIEANVARSDGMLVAFTDLPGVIFRVSPSVATGDDTGVGWSGRVGYRINRNLGVEVAYLDLSTTRVTEIYNFSSPFLPLEFQQTTEVASRISGVAVSWMGMMPLDEHFEAFVRVGLLLADQHVTRQINGFRSTLRATPEVPIPRIGTDLRLTPKWGVRLEYQRIGDVDRTLLSGPLKLRRFALGATYRF